MRSYPLISFGSMRVVKPHRVHGAENERSEASARDLAQALEQSGEAVIVKDLNAVVTYWNREAASLYGFSAEKAIGQPLSKLHAAELSEADCACLLERVRAGRPTSSTTERRKKSGEIVRVTLKTAPLLDEQGVLVGEITIARDVTAPVNEARRCAEEKLAEERERLRITLQSIDDAVITTDAQTHITYINAAAESLLGLDMKAVEGRRVDQVIHLVDPQSSKAAANLIGQSALHGTVFRRERACLLHRTDGTVCHVTDVVSPVLDTMGLVSGMVIVFRDVTLDVDRTRDLQHRAMHDPLTGLSNRAEFEQRLRAVFGKARQLDHPAAVMAIDLDRLKAVNDEAGHAAGDAVLCKVAAACRLTVRSSDIVARLGGDEFAIILDNCAEDRAKHIGQQLLRALNPLEFEWKGSRYSTGASIGLAMNTMDMSDENAWLESADKACYDAKRQGRGRLRIATRMQGDELPTKDVD